MNPEVHRPLTAILRDHFVGALTFDFTRYLIAAGALVLILALARGWAERRRIQQGRSAKRGDYWREFASSLRTVFVFAITTLTTLVMIETGFLHFSRQGFSWAAFAMQIIPMVLLHDAYFYWMHRALHHRRLFRTMHLHHHLSRTPTPWAAYSFSVWEAVTEAAFVPVYLFILGAGGIAVFPATMFVFLNHMIVRNVMGHAGVELMPKWWVDNPISDLITSTTHHDLHHSEGNHNFGLYFTWWDRWMGTEHPHYKAAFRAATTRQAATVSAAAT